MAYQVVVDEPTDSCEILLRVAQWVGVGTPAGSVGRKLMFSGFQVSVVVSRRKLGSLYLVVWCRRLDPPVVLKEIASHSAWCGQNC